MVNSHKEKAGQVVGKILEGYNWWADDADGLKKVTSDIVDAVLDCLNVTEEEQGSVGGYFMLHGGKRQWHRKGVELTTRAKELKAGAKYTSGEFMAYSIGVLIGCESKNNARWHVSLDTPLCVYAQSFSNPQTLEEAKMLFAQRYYHMYLSDYDRSNEDD
jgi:hypothetical protein